MTIFSPELQGLITDRLASYAGHLDVLRAPDFPWKNSSKVFYDWNWSGTNNFYRAFELPGSRSIGDGGSELEFCHAPFIVRYNLVLSPDNLSGNLYTVPRLVIPARTYSTAPTPSASRESLYTALANASSLPPLSIRLNQSLTRLDTTPNYICLTSELSRILPRKARQGRS